MDVLLMVNNNAIKPQTYKILIYLLSIAYDDYDYKVQRYTQQEIADKLKISRENVNKAFRQLRESNIIYKKDRDFYFNKNLFQK